MFAQHPAQSMVLGLAVVIASVPSPAAAYRAFADREPAAAPAPPAEASVKPRRTRRSERAPEEQARPRTREQLRADVLAAAARERAEIAARAADMANRHGPEASARWLSMQAQATLDPLVYLQAAGALLAVAMTEEQLRGVVRLAEDAVLLAEAPPVPRIEPEQVEQVRSESEAVQLAVARRRDAAERRKAQVALQRRGNRLSIAGGVLLSLSVAGIGMVAGGAVQLGKYHDRFDPQSGLEPPDDVAAWEAYYDQGSRLVVAGAILGTAGLVIGAPLLTFGLRERQRARESAERPTLVVRPGLASLAVAVQF